MIADVEQLPCTTNTELFYSPDEDGRTEIGRQERESLAGLMCRKVCPVWLQCLERSLVRGEMYGVWGGMGEGMRREFRTHLTMEGYGKRETPPIDELRASVRLFFLYNSTPEEKFHGVEA